MPAKALFFDVGNTLLFPNRKLMLHALHQRQMFPSEELLRHIECQTKSQFDSLLESHSAIDHGFWDIFYSRLLADLQLSDDSLHSDLLYALESRQTGAKSGPERANLCSGWPNITAWQ